MAKEDPMFDGIVKGSQAWHKHQQDIANASAGVNDDQDTGDEETPDC